MWGIHLGLEKYPHHRGRIFGVKNRKYDKVVFNRPHPQKVTDNYRWVNDRKLTHSSDHARNYAEV